ncbi:MAG: type II toxin-antitoxin system HicA family toxin [Gammaproteobacteria bacterium]|nr:type II toxin-antitoxin system HicA family toxin [Gammaproteobacteria bacterium]
MTKTDKQLNKLKTAKVLAWPELVKALKTLGYRQIQGDGARVKFDNGQPNQLINLHKPHPDKELRAYALRQVREKLTEWGLL